MDKIIITIIILFSFVNSNDFNEKKKFYYRILNETNNHNLELKEDEEGLFLRLYSNNNDLILANTTYMIVPEKYLFYGCSFYPFRDIITKIIHTKADTISSNVIHIFTLAYQLLYYKLADKEKARNIYRNKNFYSSEFFKFDLTKSQMEYLNIITLENKYNSIFSYSNELINDVKKLNLFRDFFEISENLYNIVLENVKRIKSKEDRDFILTFISNHELYKHYIYFIFRNSFFISNIEYINLKKGIINEGEFSEYMDKLMNSGYPNNICVVIGPLLDLQKISLHKNPEDNKIFSQLTLINHGNDIRFVLNENYPNNSIIYKEDFLNPLDENMYIDYGYYIYDDNISCIIEMSFNSSLKNKYDSCEKYNCWDVEYVYSENKKMITNYINLNDKQIDTSVLKICKLFSTDNSQLIEKIDSNGNLPNNIEILSRSYYYDSIYKNDYNSFTYNEIFNTIYNLKSNEDENSKIRLNLFKFGLKRKKVIINQYKIINEEMTQYIMKDLIDLKIKYLNNL